MQMNSKVTSTLTVPLVTERFVRPQQDTDFVHVKSSDALVSTHSNQARGVDLAFPNCME